MNDLSMSANEWDLGEIIAERVQPTETVSFYLNEELLYHKSILLDALDRARDPEKIEEINQRVEGVNSALENSKYTVVLHGIPRRMREDLETKALSEHKIRPDFMGNDDVMNALARQERTHILLWINQIESITNPRGQVNRNWDDESMTRIYKAFAGPGRDKINATIDDLQKRVDKFTLASMDLDFS